MKEIDQQIFSYCNSPSNYIVVETLLHKDLEEDYEIIKYICRDHIIQIIETSKILKKTIEIKEFSGDNLCREYIKKSNIILRMDENNA